MSSMWHSLVGTLGQAAGQGGGTVTIPVGAVILQIVAHASPASTLSIFGGPTMNLPANDVWRIQFMHANVVALTGANTLVFGASTTSYFVEYVLIGKGSA